MSNYFNLDQGDDFNLPESDSEHSNSKRYRVDDSGSDSDFVSPYKTPRKHRDNDNENAISSSVETTYTVLSPEKSPEVIQKPKATRTKRKNWIKAAVYETIHDAKKHTENYIQQYSLKPKGFVSRYLFFKCYQMKRI